MKYFTEEEVQGRLPMKSAIAAMREAFIQLSSGKALNQPRRRLKLPTGSVLHSMAGSFARYFGTKVYSTHPTHGAWFTFLLFDAETAQPLAQFEANYLGQIRTGAVSGLATDLLAPEGPLDVGVIGSGFQARTQVEAIAAVRSIRSLRVWSRNPAKREAFVEEMNGRGFSAQAVTAVDLAIVDAQVVITATSSKEPVIAEGTVQNGQLVLAMGSNNPQRRELPPGLVKASRIIVDDIEAARIEAGDLLLALDESEWDRVECLANLMNDKGMASGENRPTLFKSVGLGLEDVAAAAVVYEASALPIS